MLDCIMNSVYVAPGETFISNVTTAQFLICSVMSLVLGAASAAIYMFRHTYSKNFVVTLALLPFVVQMVITLVNGNLGAGIAVMGVFNLVRFRSMPGSAKDIAAVFMAMAIGLANGMGFVLLACLFTVIIAIANVLYVLSPFGKPVLPAKTLKITIPEDLEYNGVFENVLARYTSESELTEVSTTNMGSLYQLCYEIRMKDDKNEKTMIDELRCLNGNLKISCGKSAAIKGMM